MTKLASITIDTSPANIADMMSRGQFHSHQDGRWRYSPFDGETVYVNDPTEQFDAHETFAQRCAGAVCRSYGLYAQVFSDQTRGLNRWDAKRTGLLWQLYSPSYPGERQFREWTEAQLASEEA